MLQIALENLGQVLLGAACVGVPLILLAVIQELGFRAINRRR